MESTYCVYMHKNKINGKIYIGQTCQQPEKRWKDGEGYKGSSYFYSAIKKYGWSQFDHFILADNLTLEQANELEIKYIQQYKTTDDNYGYNLQSGGKNYIMSEMHKKKISEALKGIDRAGEKNSMYGKHHSEDTKNKIRQTKNSLKVRCVETGDIFDSCHLAAAWAGLKRDGHIPEVCNGNRKTAGGYHWEVVENE